MTVLQYTPPGSGGEANVYTGPLIFGPQGWETVEFIQEPWYEPSVTDCLGVKITISGDFLLSGPIEPLLSYATYTEEEDPAQRKRILTDPARGLPNIRMLNRWANPRGLLSFKENGVEMMPTPRTNKPDAKNGPIPGPMRIKRVTEKTFRCSLSIVSHWAEKPANREAGGVLSIRWRDSVSIDQDQLSTRRRSGKLIVASSEYVTGGAIIDDLRDTLICTSIMPGFIRTVSDYELDESGLQMSFNFVDVEQFRMCPLLTTFAEGSMLVSTQRMGTPGRHVTVSVNLRGPKTQESNPTVLGSLASEIAVRKARLNGGFFANKMDFRESLWKNEVGVTINGVIKPPKKVKAKYRSKKIGKQEFQKFLSFEASLKGFGKTVAGQVGTHSPDPGTRGTANILLHAAAYNDPTIARTLARLDNSLAGGGEAQMANKVPGG